jgi:hypothetical protein
MGKKLTKKEFERAPEGTHPAIITSVADLGIQISNWNGTEKHVSKWGIGFELSGPKTTDGKLFSIATTVSDSLHAKSRLHAIAKAAAGTVGNDLDMEDLLGKKVLITIVHDENDKGKWANVDTVTGLPSGITIESTDTPLSYFDLDTPDPKVYEQLPALFKKRIEARVQPENEPELEDVPQ